MLLAGGSGLNTAVVINQSSSNSLALGNYYCERRQVPPQNVLYIDWEGGNISWTNTDFQKVLLGPLLDMLAEQQLTNQIDYVVLSMDIPFEVILSDGSANGTTSALFYGLKQATAVGITNSYAFSEAVFAQDPPASASGPAFLCTMITGDTLAQAEQIVDQGVSSDGTFPSTTVVLDKTSDTARNIRYPEFDNAIFNTRLCADFFLKWTNSDSTWGETNLLGYETGLADFALSSNAFAPGAIADNLSSYGGVIFGSNSQTTELACTASGAAGSYGTVTEPGSDTNQFPNPQVYFYQARGFNLAECYYQSIREPFRGLMVGEPLAAPFARTGLIVCTNVSANAVLSGSTRLTLELSAHDGSHPLSQLDLFVDGLYFQTLTNFTPSTGNLLQFNLNGAVCEYQVPTNAALGNLASGCAAQLQAVASSNGLPITATAHGDRIELHATGTNLAEEPFWFTDTTTTNAAGVYYRAVNLPGSVISSLAPLSFDPGGAFRMQISAPANVPYELEASTNLEDWTSIFTNATGGAQEIIDPAASEYASRFYRVVVANPQPRPLLTGQLASPNGPFTLHVATQTSVPYAVQASTNLVDWTSFATNLSGGVANFTDSQTTNFPCRFYRAILLPELQPGPQLQLAGETQTGYPILQVNGAVQPYAIQVSVDGSTWSSLVTNLNAGELQLGVSSLAGSAPSLTTFLSASGTTFLQSVAQPKMSMYVYLLPFPPLPTGSTLTLVVTKTNGSVVTLTVTNGVGATGLAGMAQVLVSLVNSTGALQGGDGVLASDLDTNLASEVEFNLYARGSGAAAAGIQAQLTAARPLLTSTPHPVNLNQNLSDLQPRSHVYLSTGAVGAVVDYSLNSIALPDGYHQLDFVAYEGSNVRTQTRLTLPVVVQNTSLMATLSSPDLPATAPVQGTYHLQVTANTNNITAITLFSTGGAIGSSSNQSSADFTVNGPGLGVGLHPFYALVQSESGFQYRTATFWARLTAN